VSPAFSKRTSAKTEKHSALSALFPSFPEQPKAPPEKAASKKAGQLLKNHKQKKRHPEHRCNNKNPTAPSSG